ALCYALSFFFFQAEDGIRDFHVTGVQTCALPISATVVLPTPPFPVTSRMRISAPGYPFPQPSQRRGDDLPLRLAAKEAGNGEPGDHTEAVGGFGGSVLLGGEHVGALQHLEVGALLQSP